MPPVTLKGHSCTGHSCFPPRGNSQGNPRFTVQQTPVHCQGHAYPAHSCPDCVPHAAVLAAGAARMTVSGQQIGRIGDPVSCGGSAAEGISRFTVGDYA